MKLLSTRSFILELLATTFMDSGKFWPLYTIDGHPMHKNVIVEREDGFTTHIRYRFKLENYCFKCGMPFLSHNDLRHHKRTVHSY